MSVWGDLYREWHADVLSGAVDAPIWIALLGHGGFGDRLRGSIFGTVWAMYEGAAILFYEPVRGIDSHEDGMSHWLSPREIMWNATENDVPGMHHPIEYSDEVLMDIFEMISRLPIPLKYIGRMRFKSELDFGIRRNHGKMRQVFWMANPAPQAQRLDMLMGLIETYETRTNRHTPPKTVVPDRVKAIRDSLRNSDLDTLHVCMAQYLFQPSPQAMTFLRSAISSTLSHDVKIVFPSIPPPYDLRSPLSTILPSGATRRLHEKRIIGIHFRSMIESAKFVEDGISILRYSTDAIDLLFKCAEKLQEHAGFHDASFLFVSDNLALSRKVQSERENVIIPYREDEPFHVDHSGADPLGMHRSDTFAEALLLSMSDALVMTRGGFSAIAAAFGQMDPSNVALYTREGECKIPILPWGPDIHMQGRFGKWMGRWQ